jgi:N-acetylglucosamine-6-phosphate deacetylase
MIALCADVLYTPLEEINEPVLLVEDGRISSIFSRSHEEIPRNAKVVDFSARDSGEAGRVTLVPGFLDIHIHGSGGVDVMRAPLGDLPRLNRFLATRGVTGYFPTTVAAPLDETCRALERLADAIEAAGSSRVSADAAEAQPLGVHLEGPFLSHQRRGVHPPEYLIAPTVETFERMWQAARGHVKMMTIAPELPGAPEVIADATRRGVCVSIGHSDATLGEARAGVRAGARHATHTFNAMRPLDHRDPGVLGEVLTDGELSADIIADGIHLAPEIVKLFLRAKGFEKSVLITDATAAAGMPDGKYMLGPIEVEVKDGKCTSNGSLAGSVLTMDRAVRNVSKFAGWSMKDAVRAATMNPANAAGLEQHGKLVPGAEANIVVLAANGEVRKTIVGGRIL